MQLNVFEVHRFESNPASQIILDANRDHFSKQCRVIFDALMSGEQMNSHMAVVEYKIVDFRRRLADLRAAGVLMTWVPSENGRSKEWIMTNEQKIFNQKFK